MMFALKQRDTLCHPTILCAIVMPGASDDSAGWHGIHQLHSHATVLLLPWHFPWHQRGHLFPAPWVFPGAFQDQVLKKTKVPAATVLIDRSPFKALPKHHLWIFLDRKLIPSNKIQTLNGSEDGKKAWKTIGSSFQHQVSNLPAVFFFRNVNFS